MGFQSRDVKSSDLDGVSIERLPIGFLVAALADDRYAFLFARVFREVSQWPRPPPTIVTHSVCGRFPRGFVVAAPADDRYAFVLQAFSERFFSGRARRRR